MYHTKKQVQQVPSCLPHCEQASSSLRRVAAAKLADNTPFTCAHRLNLFFEIMYVMCLQGTGSASTVLTLQMRYCLYRLATWAAVCVPPTSLLLYQYPQQDL
jgi:hypothetical protein